MHDRFLILCRSPNPATSALRSAVSLIGEATVISDTQAGDDCHWIPDDLMEGYDGLHGWSPHCPVISAWSRAWKYLEDRHQDFTGGLWLVEDDVAFDQNVIGELVGETRAIHPDFAGRVITSRSDDPGWPHWHLAEGYFPTPFKSFNPLCHLSYRLILDVMEFRKACGRFTFQEVLFASLAAARNYHMLDWMNHSATNRLFGTFRYRPEVPMGESEGIRHPVKHLRESKIPNLG